MKHQNGRAAVIIVVILIIVGLCAGGYFLWKNKQAGPQATTAVSLYEVTRGDLKITVTESGEIKALDPIKIKSEVEGRTTIVSAVEEGTEITEADVANGKILVELESSNFEDKLMQEEMSYNDRKANLANAQESLNIRIKQNESDLSRDRLSIKFALIDFEKYLGEELAKELLAGLDPNGMPSVDIVTLSEVPNLGGDALQKVRELISKISLAEEDLERARSELTWTERLAEKEYASKSELQADRFEVNRLQINLEKAKLEIDLFRRYEFPKQVEKLLSDYREAIRALERTQASARSKLAQAEADLASSQARFNLQQKRLNDMFEQAEKYVIRAPAAGMVVYSTGGNRWNPRRIEVGEEVSHRQELMQITNLDDMGVDVKVHETVVHKIKPGLKAYITMDAMTDEAFEGEVLKVGRMADQDRFLNPELKVYNTDVRLHGQPKNLRPGMSAKVEIEVKELTDIIFVPVHAIVKSQGRQYVFVKTAAGLEQREVRTGDSNESFIEVVQGLNPGETISLTPPKPAGLNPNDKPQMAIQADQAAKPKTDGTVASGAAPASAAVPAKQPAPTAPPAAQPSGTPEKKPRPDGQGKPQRPEGAPRRQGQGQHPDGGQGRPQRPAKEPARAD